MEEIPLFFSRDFRQNASEHVPHEIDFLRRENVVSHATYNESVPSKVLQSRIYGVRPARSLKPMGIFSIGQSVGSPHYRVNTSPRRSNIGKFLVFRSKNLIRAGKHTAAQALRHTINFGRWAVDGSSGYVWHTAVSTPNMVLSGKLRRPPSPSIRSHWAVTHSSKYPGMAVTTHTSCTPEIYNSGAMIMPGVTSACLLQKPLSVISDVLKSSKE